MPKCKWCKEPTTNRIGLRYLCNIEHAIAYGKAEAQRKQLKQKAEIRKYERQEHRAAKEKIKTLAKLCAEARTVVQRFARLRDQQWGICICCGCNKIDDGAHRFPVGSKYRCARISLNPRQIHGACAKCNRFIGGGNVDGYNIGLEMRYGKGIIEELAELKRKADNGEDAPLTKPEVREIKAEYLAKCRELASISRQ